VSTRRNRLACKRFRATLQVAARAFRTKKE
jgi:hypothetical protein